MKVLLIILLVAASLSCKKKQYCWEFEVVCQGVTSTKLICFEEKDREPDPFVDANGNACSQICERT